MYDNQLIIDTELIYDTRLLYNTQLLYDNRLIYDNHFRSGISSICQIGQSLDGTQSPMKGSEISMASNEISIFNNVIVPVDVLVPFHDHSFDVFRRIGSQFSSKENAMGSHGNRCFKTIRFLFISV